MHIFHAPFHYHVHPIPGKSGCLGVSPQTHAGFFPNWHPPDLRMTVLLKCHKQPLWSCRNVKCALSQFFVFFFVPLQTHGSHAQISSYPSMEPSCFILVSGCLSKRHDYEALSAILKEKKSSLLFLKYVFTE